MKTNSKSMFEVRQVNKSAASSILDHYHYLSKLSKGFRSGYNYGLFNNNELVGIAIFTGLSVPELAKGMLGLERNEQQGLFELSRLCLEPNIQAKEHNLASWFLSRAIKMLRKETNVRLILSYADADYHSGVVYAACNFNYYGLTAAKKDFYIRQEDGTFVKHTRGKVKGLDGEWRTRTQKHRFLMVLDSSLKVRWKEERWKNPNYKDQKE